MKTYSEAFTRDVAFYLYNRYRFTFNGQLEDKSLFHVEKSINVYQHKIDVVPTDLEDYLIISFTIKQFMNAFPELLEKLYKSKYEVCKGMFTIQHYKLIEEVIPLYDKSGVSGVEAFHQLDSNGKIVTTRHPNILKTLLRTKASVNFHIKMYAESIADWTLFEEELDEYTEKFKAPEWFKEAVMNQAIKIRYK